MLRFTSKADTLRQLEGALQWGRVLPQKSFTVEQYKEGSENLLHELELEGWFLRTLIIRSSSQEEDTCTASNAGKFLSIGNVNGKAEVLQAISNVIGSMGDNHKNQVLIQPYLEKVDACGVVFTIDPNTGGNYYVLNYDDELKSTNSVTSGDGEHLKTYYSFKGEHVPPLHLQGIVKVCAELEKLFENQALDIEFAVCHNQVYVLQVRPLIVRDPVADIVKQQSDIKKIKNKLSLAMGAQPNILGEKTIFGVMPDWNPAEMLGIRPHPLALSLYKEIITDGVWAYQRNNYGYRNLRSFPLMVDFCGIPYIDTRVSFNSFMPKDIPEPLAEKLINYYIQELEKNPSKHDKIEFDIAFTCYTFDLPTRLKALAADGFSKEELLLFEQSLRKLTCQIIDSEQGILKKDSQKIDELIQKHKVIMESDMGALSKIYWLLEYCKRYGTLPFAGLARAGFIAVEFLKSMVSIQIITEEERLLYMNSLSTVGKNISIDFNSLTKEVFLRKYGHLRPGTYDICSNRYDKSGDYYFDFSGQTSSSMQEEKEFRLSLKQYEQIQKKLSEHGFDITPLQLFDFMKMAIEGREYSKFVFTKTLSDVLELLAAMGAEYGLSRDDMSYVTIWDIQKAYSASDDIEDILKESVGKGRRKYEHTKTLILPPLLSELSQATDFFMPTGEPNFITQKLCEGDVIILSESNMDIEGKIVFMKSADPGYDWIFSRQIAGFITAYGGINSHMAIRSAELGIASVIGAGEKLWEYYSRAQRLQIDCMNRKVTILK